MNEGPSEGKSPRTLSQEVEMAEKLIEDMTRDWNPAIYKNTYREEIMKYVKARVKAGKATEISQDFKESDGEGSSDVVDLLPLLRKSLAEKKNKSRLRRV